MSNNRRTSNWLINGGLVAGSLLVGLMLAEIVLRVVGFSAPVFWTYDDVTGSKLYAGAKGWQRDEGEAFVAISSDGLRDREHSRTKPPNTVRIAVLGDSMAEAMQVDSERAFWSVLERELKRCRVYGDREVEVVNFGVSGYGTAQELLTFRHRAAAYSPDVTVLAVYPGNDVRNNSRTLEPFKLRPFFAVRDGKLLLDDSFRRHRDYLSFKASFEKRRFFFESRIFQLVRKLKTLVEQWQVLATDAAPEGIEPGEDDRVFLAPSDPVWKEAWLVTERLIAATREEVVGRGGRFLVVAIPIGIQVHPDPKVRARFESMLRVDGLWYPDTRIGEFARKEGIDAIMLGRAFRSFAEANQVYLYGFRNTRLGTGHLNENGHKLVGESLAARLCQSD